MRQDAPLDEVWMFGPPIVERRGFSQLRYSSAGQRDLGCEGGIVRRF
jgi:hypothetical protein